MWTGEGLGRHRDAITQVLPGHGSRLLRVGQVSGGPCPPPAPPQPAQYYEADDPANTLTAPASVAACSGCSGGEKVGNLVNGGAVQFNHVTAQRGGSYALTIHYAADDERTGYVSVNGGPEHLVGFFPRTGGWDTVGTYRLRVQLHAGTNTITYLTHAGPGGFPGPRTYSPDLDGISVATSG